MRINIKYKDARGLLVTDLVILNHGEVTKTTPELVPPPPEFHTTSMGGRLSLGSPAISNNRTIGSVITRLGTKRVKGMQIPTDGQESYTNHYPNCPNVQLSPQHILSCPAIQARIFKVRQEDTEYFIFSDKAIMTSLNLSKTASERSKA
ncbi:hypothetical protein TNCV_1705731 [Trichonephila clavipes]|uniref:Uncharacterized protein n=1 Tax=Trichonephila clavipes TaxID=2585209 RepID=A0A8X6UYJ7_TRICX|nr:hypothetical protein TNCV_1705731 [Trichonephila clavipes]